MKREIEHTLERQRHPRRPPQKPAPEKSFAQPRSYEEGLPTNKEQKTIESTVNIREFGPNEYITDMAISPNAPIVALSTLDRSRTKIALWNHRTGHLVRALADDTRVFKQIEWSLDGLSLFALERYEGNDHKIYEFHVSSGTEREALSSRSEISWMLIGASGIEAVGLQQTGPRPVRSGKIQGSKADFASNYKVDGFGFFIPLQNDSKRTRPSLALSPQVARDSRARLMTKFMNAARWAGSVIRSAAS
jgi:WD40 repeat protein